MTIANTLEETYQSMMDHLRKWYTFFTRSNWTVHSCCLRGSWKTTDKIKIICLLSYCILEEVRCIFVSTLDDLESSLMFGGIYHPLGITGRICTLANAILLNQSFLVQVIIWFNPLSCFHVLLSPTQRIPKGHTRTSLQLIQQLVPEVKHQSLESEIRFICKFAELSLPPILRFYEVVAFICALNYLWINSYSLPSVILTIFWSTMQLIHLEIFIRDSYMIYWLKVISVKRVTFAVDGLFQQLQQSVDLQCVSFARLRKSINLLNSLESKLATTGVIHTTLLNGCLLYAAVSIPRDQNVVMIVSLAFVAIAVFVSQSMFYFSVASLYVKGQDLSKRVYNILYHHQNELTSGQKRKLLMIIKSQSSGKSNSRLCITLFGGQIFDTRVHSKHTSWSLRMVIMLFKLIK